MSKEYKNERGLFMYNKDLYNKIINASCSFEELEFFVSDIDKKELDLDNAFEKYYDVNKILYVINRYENKEVGDKYLTYWMNAYNWIIMAGFKIESKNNEISFRDWVVWKISDWLDGLSFFDDSDDWVSLEDYKSSFKVIDGIYKNINEWDCVFAHTDERGGYDDAVVFLVVNDKTKELVKIYGNLDYLNAKVDFSRIEEDELEEKIEQLKKVGYQELRYGLF